MSEDSVQDDTSSPGPSDAVLRTIRDWYHVPVLLVAFAYMLWVRVQSRDAFTVDGNILFSGNDAYYHYRQVVYTTKHWPETMPFDPWTYFPYGTSVGQFGTLYDQLVATGALLIGGGSPTEHQAALALLFAPAVFGALTAIPVYLIGKRLGGRAGGILAAVVIALLPGLFLQRSLIGASDHNGAEPFFQAFAILGLMISVALGDRHRPVLEQFTDRDYEGIATIAGWSILAGVATALYLWLWPPGVLIVGIYGVFVLLKTVSDFHSGISPDHIAVPSVISMTTAGLLMLLPLGTMAFSPTKFSLIQPFLAFAVAFGSIFLAWLAREWEARDLDSNRYGPAVGGIFIVGVAVTALVAPSIYNLITTNLLRIVGFGTTATTATIGEAQPWMSRAASFGVENFWVIFLDYGLAFHTAMLGALWLLFKPHIASRNIKRVGLVAAFLGATVFLFVAPSVPTAIGDIIGMESALVSLLIVVVFLAAIIVTGQYESEELLAVVWAAFISSAAFTQIRFNYYLAVCVAVFNAYLFAQFVGYFEIPSFASIREPLAELDYERLNAQIDTSQVLVVFLLLLVVLVPLASSPVVSERDIQVPTAQSVGNSTGPGGFQNWQSSLQWMNENTPAEGNWANANNEFEYYGTYGQTEDFDYDEGAYGVMSWWDYGHWITVEAERIPNANPFQEGSTTAANYLLAPSEERGEGILDEMDEDDAKTRYVMVDWQMIKTGSKFGAPIQFYDDGEVGATDFSHQAIILDEENRPSRYFQFRFVKHQRYYDSMMVRLYRYHGSAKSPEPVVVDWDVQNDSLYGQNVFIQNSTQSIKRFENMSAAKAYVENDSTSQIGGISNLPSEYVPALQHYRLVALSDDELAPTNYIFNGELRNAPTYVKMFERVEGARVRGTAPANSTVTASVMMNIDAFNTSFQYQQRAETGENGEFEMVLPYSTTGYENWGPENGHTNVSVRADGPYEFTTGARFESSGETLEIVTYNATADVAEAKVIGEDDDLVTVDLDRTVIGGQNQASNDSTNQSASSLMADDVELESSSRVSVTGETATSSPSVNMAGPVVGSLGGLPISSRRLAA